MEYTGESRGCNFVWGGWTRVCSVDTSRTVYIAALYPLTTYSHTLCMGDRGNGVILDRGFDYGGVQPISIGGARSRNKPLREKLIRAVEYGRSDSRIFQAKPAVYSSR